jgi:hypothetical protein
MRHAGPAALDALEPLLAQIRQLPILRETSRGIFYLRSRAFLHFHEDPAGLFADLRPPGQADFERIQVNGADDGSLMSRVRAALRGA